MDAFARRERSLRQRSLIGGRTETSETGASGLSSMNDPPGTQANGLLSDSASVESGPRHILEDSPEMQCGEFHGAHQRSSMSPPYCIMAFLLTETRLSWNPQR